MELEWQKRYPKLADIQGAYGDLLSDEQVAEFLGVSVHFLRRKRQRGETGGPKTVQLGSRVRYRKEDVAEFLDQGGSK